MVLEEVQFHKEPNARGVLSEFKCEEFRLPDLDDGIAKNPA